MNPTRDHEHLPVSWHGKVFMIMEVAGSVTMGKEF
jgi:hypothetical protein